MNYYLVIKNILLFHCFPYYFGKMPGRRPVIQGYKTDFHSVLEERQSLPVKIEAGKARGEENLTRECTFLLFLKCRTPNFSKKASNSICGFEEEILPSNWTLSASSLFECHCSM